MVNKSSDNNSSYNKKIRDNIDNWHLSDIGMYADHLSKLPSEHNIKNSGPIDKVIRQVVPKMLPALPAFSFEVGPWLALLALVERNFPKSRPLTYGGLIKKQEFITMLIDRNKSVFGYGGISNSLASYTTKELLDGNSHIGTNTLGELISTLSQGPNTDQALDSINTLNLMLNEFALINQFDNINSVSDLSYATKNIIDTALTKNLSIQHDFPIGLIEEINDFVLQIYTEHPFSDKGINIYTRPSIVRNYTQKLTNNVFKKNVQAKSSEHPIEYNNDAVPALHDNFDSDKTIKDGVSDLHAKFDSDMTHMATCFVKQTLGKYNDLFSKRELLQKIDPNKSPTTKFNIASLKDFIAFDSENASLLISLDEYSKNKFEVKKLFVHLDQYLISLALATNSDQPKLYGTSLPLNKVRYIIQEYDSTSATESFNPEEFKQNLRITLTSGTDEIISYLNKYKENINQSLKDTSDEPDKDLAHFMGKLKELMKPLNSNQDFSKVWNDLINSNNA